MEYIKALLIKADNSKIHEQVTSYINMVKRNLYTNKRDKLFCEKKNKMQKYV